MISVGYLRFHGAAVDLFDAIIAINSFAFVVICAADRFINFYILIGHDLFFYSNPNIRKIFYNDGIL